MPKPDCPAPRRNRARGFTLIELLVAVAIIGLLLALALPSYQSQVRKSRRIDAKGALLEFAAREEKFYAVNNIFSASASDLGYSSLPLAISSGGSGSSFYELSVTLSNNNQAFHASATPVSGQTDDTDCYAFELDQTGAKSNQDSDGNALDAAACW